MWPTLDRLAGTGRDATDEERWRGRFVSALCVAAFAVTLVQALAYTFVSAWPNVLAQLVGLVVEVAWLLTWRKWKKASLQADLFAGFATTVYTASLVFNKDISNLVWLAVTPLLALFIGGGRVGLRWAVVDALAIFAGVALVVSEHAPAAIVPVTWEDVLTRVVGLLVVLPTVGVLWDLSARSIMKDLARATEEAEAANREKLRFLANVSHELRTPLHGLLGMAELLRSEVPPESQSRLDTMEESGRLLAQLIDDLLDVARGESGKLKLVSSSAQLDELVRRAVEVHRAGAVSRGLVLELVTEGPVGQRVSTDARRVQQVVHNLVSNAVKFTRAGRIEVRLKAEAHDERLDVTLAVKDSGPGIARSEQERLFLPFSRISEDHRITGTGLGLSISRAIVEQLGGRIEVDSDLGAGTTFTVRFSAALVATPAVTQTPPLGLEAARAPSEPLVARILVVDDNAINRRLATAQLERLGATVVTAEDGVRALDLLSHGSFDLVLMDRHMPELDGLETTRRWRAREQTTGGHLAIVGVTASVMPQDLADCRDAGMDLVLTKPLPLEVLRQVVTSVVKPIRAAG